MRAVIALALVASSCASSARSKRSPLQHVMPSHETSRATWAPPTDDDLAHGCPELFAEMEAIYADVNDLDRREIVERLVEDPPELPAPQLAWCARKLRAFAASRPPELEREAAATFESFIEALERHVEQPEHGHAPGALCPSAGPVPATIPASGRTVTPPEPVWLDDAGWECLGQTLVWAQHFQYEVRADTSAQTFTLFARRIDERGRTVELTLRGRIDAQHHVIMDSTIDGPNGPIRRRR